MFKFNKVRLSAAGLCIFLASCGKSSKLVIFHAGSLAAPFRQLEEQFETKCPGINVQREASGSREAAKKICALGRQADLIAVADYTIFDSLLLPEYVDWYLKFARNKMVIAYTEKSKYAAELTQENWFEILQRLDVKWGHSNPDADPCGYRTILVEQLAEKYYRRPGLAQKIEDSCPRKNVRPKSTELIILLQSQELDYAFEYQSVAVQYGLKFLQLPEEIDLSSDAYRNFYNQATITLTDGKIKKGEPIIYGITIPAGAKNKKAAREFLKLIFSPEGKQIMQNSGQPLIPLTAKNPEKLPAELLFATTDYDLILNSIP